MENLVDFSDLTIVERLPTFRADRWIERIQASEAERMHAIDDTRSLAIVVVVVFKADAAGIHNFFISNFFYSSY